MLELEELKGQSSRSSLARRKWKKMNFIDWDVILVLLLVSVSKPTYIVVSFFHVCIVPLSHISKFYNIGAQISLWQGRSNGFESDEAMC